MQQQSNVLTDLNLRQLLLAFLMLTGGSIVLSACDMNEGPMEETSKQIDEATEEVKDEVDDNT